MKRLIPIISSLIFAAPHAWVFANSDIGGAWGNQTISSGYVWHVYGFDFQNTSQQNGGVQTAKFTDVRFKLDDGLHSCAVVNRAGATFAYQTDLVGSISIPKQPETHQGRITAGGPYELVFTGAGETIQINKEDYNRRYSVQSAISVRSATPIFSIVCEYGVTTPPSYIPGEGRVSGLNPFSSDGKYDVGTTARLTNLQIERDPEFAHLRIDGNSEVSLPIKQKGDAGAVPFLRASIKVPDSVQARARIVVYQMSDTQDYTFYLRHRRTGKTFELNRENTYELIDGDFIDIAVRDAPSGKRTISLRYEVSLP